VVASYSSAISYQWQRRVTVQNGSAVSSPQWADVAGRTTASTSFTEAFVGTVEYRVVLSASGAAPVTSSMASVAFTSPAATITITQISPTVSESGYYQTYTTAPVELSISATSEATISYQWQQRRISNQSFVPYPANYQEFYAVDGGAQASVEVTEGDAGDIEYRCVLTAPGASTVISPSVIVRYYVPTP